MSSVAEIAPFGGGPGLIALICAECGTTDSVLVHQAHKSQQTARSRVLERAAAMSLRGLDTDLEVSIAPAIAGNALIDAGLG
jgi:hypothetical protein